MTAVFTHLNDVKNSIRREINRERQVASLYESGRYQADQVAHAIDATKARSEKARRQLDRLEAIEIPTDEEIEAEILSEEVRIHERFERIKKCYEEAKAERRRAANAYLSTPEGFAWDAGGREGRPPKNAEYKAWSKAAQMAREEYGLYREAAMDGLGGLSVGANLAFGYLDMTRGPSETALREAAAARILERRVQEALAIHDRAIII